jgi:hypothetical protein
MTAELFDRLLFTDCRPGTGRGAGGGFQVQAQSSGVDSAQSKLAVGGLLYDIQLPWLTERRAVEDFPLGFAHVTGEGYGTAQSMYLGKVATGGRDGNHLADCLLTRDPDLYGTLRPAQLWRSALWRAEPWDDKDCPLFDAAELEPGPLTVDAIADWSRAVPERGQVLARLVSVLEDPDGKRVIITTDDAREAMAWIAAATLLLPSRVGLGISFKVFSSSPLDARHRIAAAPAGLFPRITPGLVSQRFVLDARTCAADEAQISDRAAFFAGRFAGDADPYDVVDAVELSDALGGGRDAMLTAWALTKPDDLRPEPAALFRWLNNAEPGPLREHGRATADLILEAAPPVRTLRWIDRAVTDERLDLRPAAVRVQLLAAELVEIRDGQAPPREVLSRLSLDASACRDAQSELSSAMLLGSDHQVDLLLCLARRHGIAPELAPPLQKRLHDFVNGWIDDSGAYHPDDWALGAEVLDCAHDELRDRAGRHGASSVAGPIRRLARYFADEVGLAERLDCHIQAALLADRTRQDRIPRLRQLLATIANSTQPGLAATAAAELQHALIEWNAVDGDVAVTVLIDLPDAFGVKPGISDCAVRQLTQMSEKPTRGLLELLTSLDKRGKAPSSGPLAGVLKSDRYVREFIRRASDHRQLADRKYFDDTAKLLRQADAAVVRARLDEVLNACLQTRHPDLGPEVLATPRSRLPEALIERWAGTLGTSRDLVGDAFFYLRCWRYKDLPTRRQELLTSGIRTYAQRLDKAVSDRWRDAVAGRLRPEEREVWESVFVQEAPRPRISLWTSRDGGR